MGATIAKLIAGLQGLLFVAAIVVIILLIIRRVKIKKEETFQKRDN
jgi:hypothetical protein